MDFVLKIMDNMKISAFNTYLFTRGKYLLKPFYCPQCKELLSSTKSRCKFCGVLFIVNNVEKQVIYDKNEIHESNDKKNAHLINFFGSEFEFLEKEYPVMNGFANLFISLSESIGGKLLLTNQRLFFQSNEKNKVGSHQHIDFLHTFTSAKIDKNLLISQIILLEGKFPRKYVVYKGKKWINQLSPLIKKATSPNL